MEFAPKRARISCRRRRERALRSSFAFPMPRQVHLAQALVTLLRDALAAGGRNRVEQRRRQYPKSLAIDIGSVVISSRSGMSQDGGKATSTDALGKGSYRATSGPLALD
jgi:hypothetical protein